MVDLIADMVARHSLRGMTTVNGRSSCEYCKRPGYSRQGWAYEGSYKHAPRQHSDFEEFDR